MTDYTVLEKSQPERRYTLGIVYEPNVTDTQGDFAKAEDIENAAWEFMARQQALAKCAGVVVKQALLSEEDGIDIELSDDLCKFVQDADGLDDEHLQLDDETLGVIVESYLAPTDFTVEGQPVKKGSWLLGVRWTPEMFEKIKKGERTGLSMYGRTDRSDA